jgi:hypothetical protein
VNPDDHAIIYTGSNPSQFEGEILGYDPIQVLPKSSRDKLDRSSRVNYAKIYTVEHNLKVGFIGWIADSS